MRQSRHFPKVNQRNKFGHNHGVSARNDFADNPCALTSSTASAVRARTARGKHPTCILRSLGRPHLKNMPALAYDRKPAAKCAVAPPGDYRIDFVAPATPSQFIFRSVREI
jgi:hypothetical protein